LPAIWSTRRRTISAPPSSKRPRALANQHGAAVRAIVGEARLAENFPLIHAVGRASCQAPRLIDVAWGDTAAPKVTVVGKGVTFDTGGLDIKPESGMQIMKKDMGGAASALALAHMVMDRGLDIRLRVLVPAVENAISGSAFRPLDVYRSRKGLSVEIGNTDAEGRLVLADALTLADEEAPELVIDLATLTGAARVALGPDLPPFYTEDEALAAELSASAAAENDPLWRMPLWRGYDSMLESKIADVRNAGSGGFAGSITAALFLRNRRARKAVSAKRRGRSTLCLPPATADRAVLAASGAPENTPRRKRSALPRMRIGRCIALGSKSWRSRSGRRRRSNCCTISPTRW
jgi:leucyl aminopeptidase